MSGPSIWATRRYASLLMSMSFVLIILGLSADVLAGPCPCAADQGKCQRDKCCAKKPGCSVLQCTATDPGKRCCAHDDGLAGNCGSQCVNTQWCGAPACGREALICREAPAPPQGSGSNEPGKGCGGRNCENGCQDLKFCKTRTKPCGDDKPSGLTCHWKPDHSNARCCIRGCTQGPSNGGCCSDCWGTEWTQQCNQYDCLPGIYRCCDGSGDGEGNEPNWRCRGWPPLSYSCGDH